MASRDLIPISPRGGIRPGEIWIVWGSVRFAFVNFVQGHLSFDKFYVMIISTSHNYANKRKLKFFLWLLLIKTKRRDARVAEGSTLLMCPRFTVVRGFESLSLRFICSFFSSVKRKSENFEILFYLFWDKNYLTKQKKWFINKISNKSFITFLWGYDIMKRLLSSAG